MSLIKHDFRLSCLKSRAPGEFGHFGGLCALKRLVEKRQCDFGLFSVRRDFGGNDLIEGLGCVARFRRMRVGARECRCAARGCGEGGEHGRYFE